MFSLISEGPRSPIRFSMTIIQKCLQYFGSSRRVQNFQQKFSLSHFVSKLSEYQQSPPSSDCLIQLTCAGSSQDFLMNQSLVVMRSFAAQKLRRLHSLESYSSKMSERNNLVNLMNSLMRRMMSSRTKHSPEVILTPLRLPL